MGGPTEVEPLLEFGEDVSLRLQLRIFVFVRSVQATGRGHARLRLYNGLTENPNKMI